MSAFDDTPDLESIGHDLVHSFIGTIVETFVIGEYTKWKRAGPISDLGRY